MNPSFWTPGKKAAIVIILGVLSFLLSQYFQYTAPERKGPVDTTQAFLIETYNSYNESYFDRNLPGDAKITYDLMKSDNMAETLCDVTGRKCSVRFNPHYSAAPRVAADSMLHEMCHMKVWARVQPSGKPAGVSDDEYIHGPQWQACMLQLDWQGAFRRINIDYYKGN